MSQPRKGITSGLASFRRTLRKHSRFAQFVRATRAVIHFGPWRHAARAYVRAQRPPLKADSPDGSLLGNVEPRAVIAALRADSMCLVGRLPAEPLTRLQALTSGLPVNQYARFHEQSRDAHDIVNDAGVLGVVRAYFGAEPVLLECNLVVQEAEENAPLTPTSQRRFHFDYAGWHSLNLFVYLTDVYAESGAHEVVVGTHRSKSLRDALRASFDDDEIERRFGDRIRTITGPAGTMFFEDTEAFHRRRAVRDRRVMLNVLFASHRGWFSRGRLGRTNAQHIQSGARGAPKVSRSWAEYS